MSVLDVPIKHHKADLAYQTAVKHGARSVADIGGCWGVNGGYIFDILKRIPSIENAAIVDWEIPPLVKERAAAFPQLSLMQGLFNRSEFIDGFPEVDALLMFDILLHQVDLDWNDFLVAFGKKARILIIYNQMWTQDQHTIRFIERGREWYKENVFFTNAENIDRWFAEHDKPDLRHEGRPRRDVHNFWQWGITRNDLIDLAEGNGFRLDYFQDYGPFAGRAWIPNQGFVFVRR